ncbi:unnamed protein product [Soboliphyme baturini]|uniref:Transposase n=1 Tax=Soboliphyme baturini TaxID=241478 RepID=A0A183I9Q4_9BILA|nr:unnamed protein product [Soboliphyme baturini]
MTKVTASGHSDNQSTNRSNGQRSFGRVVAVATTDLVLALCNAVR